MPAQPRSATAPQRRRPHLPRAAVHPYRLREIPARIRNPTNLVPETFDPPATMSSSSQSPPASSHRATLHRCHARPDLHAGPSHHRVIIQSAHDDERTAHSGHPPFLHELGSVASWSVRDQAPPGGHPAAAHTVVVVCGQRDNGGFTAAGPNGAICTAPSVAVPALAVGDPSMGART